MLFVTGELTEMNCPWCDRRITLFLSTQKYCKYCGKNVIPTQLALRLKNKIKALTSEDVLPYIHRCYPGHWQRSEGAWLWSMDGVGISIGSCWTAKSVARAKNVSNLRHIGSVELIVECDNE